MKNFVLKGLLVSLGAVSVNALAESKLQLGGGFFHQVVKTEFKQDHSDHTVNNKGLFVSGRYSFAENFAVEAEMAFSNDADFELDAPYYSGSLDVGDFSSFYMSTNFLVGTSFATPGWYGYTGIGLYRDTWKEKDEYGKYEETFTGFQVPLGVGYHFTNVSLDAKLLLQSGRGYYDSDEDDSTQAAIFRLGILANF
ncbi:outer membrane beta-barrel protein [Rhodanobacter aciditrophus]|uniref:Outer membrane beta-barrel protein n=1 Tax=Rhodanobacter aciditrophus TaxID=1623218 RepID=A0ABW4B0S2_9GAMM